MGFFACSYIALTVMVLPCLFRGCHHTLSKPTVPVSLLSINIYHIGYEANLKCKHTIIIYSFNVRIIFSCPVSSGKLYHMCSCDSMRVMRADNILSLLRKYSWLCETSERVFRNPRDHTLAVSALENQMELQRCVIKMPWGYRRGYEFIWAIGKNC